MKPRQKKKIIILLWLLVLVCIGCANLYTFAKYVMTRIQYNEEIREMIMNPEHVDNEYLKLCKIRDLGVDDLIHPMEEYPFLRGKRKNIVVDTGEHCFPYSYYNHISLTLVVINIMMWGNEYAYI